MSVFGIQFGLPPLNSDFFFLFLCIHIYTCCKFTLVEVFSSGRVPIWIFGDICDKQQAALNTLAAIDHHIDSSLVRNHSSSTARQGGYQYLSTIPAEIGFLRRLYSNVSDQSDG